MCGGLEPEPQTRYSGSQWGGAFLPVVVVVVVMVVMMVAVIVVSVVMVVLCNCGLGGYSCDGGGGCDVCGCSDDSCAVVMVVVVAVM